MSLVLPTLDFEESKAKGDMKSKIPRIYAFFAHVKRAIRSIEELIDVLDEAPPQRSQSFRDWKASAVPAVESVKKALNRALPHLKEKECRDLAMRCELLNGLTSARGPFHIKKSRDWLDDLHSALELWLLKESDKTLSETEHFLLNFREFTEEEIDHLDDLFGLLGQARRQPCFERNLYFYGLNQEGLGPAEIRDHWNNLSKQKRLEIAESSNGNIGKRRDGSDVVKKAIRAIKRLEALGVSIEAARGKSIAV